MTGTLSVSISRARVSRGRVRDGEAAPAPSRRAALEAPGLAVDPDAVSVPPPALVPPVGVVESEGAGPVELGQVPVPHPHGHEVDPERGLVVALALLGGAASPDGGVPVTHHCPTSAGPVEEMETRTGGVRDHHLPAVRGGLDEDVRQVSGRGAVEPVGEPGEGLVARLLHRARVGPGDELDEGVGEVLGLEQGGLDDAGGEEVGVVRGDLVQRLEPARPVSAFVAVERREELRLAKVHGARRPRREHPQHRPQHEASEALRPTGRAVGGLPGSALDHHAVPWCIRCRRPARAFTAAGAEPSRGGPASPRCRDVDRISPL